MRTKTKQSLVNKLSLRQQYGLGSLLCFLLLGMMLSLPACLPKEDGCRDVFATNFEADADTDCEDCCRYPKITFEVDHAVGDTSLSYRDTLDFDNKVFQFIQTAFYIYDLSLENASEQLRITDQRTFRNRSGGSTILTDDVALISRDILSFSYDIGSFQGQGSYNQLHFTVGLSPTLATTAPSTLPTSHPLASSEGLFTDPDSTYVFTRLGVIDIPMEDTMRYDLMTPVNITLPFTVTIDRGSNLVVPLKIDYQKWMEGINFAADMSVTRQNIADNIQNAFSIRQ